MKITDVRNPSFKIKKQSVSSKIASNIGSSVTLLTKASKMINASESKKSEQFLSQMPELKELDKIIKTLSKIYDDFHTKFEYSIDYGDSPQTLEDTVYDDSGRETWGN